MFTLASVKPRLAKPIRGVFAALRAAVHTENLSVWLPNSGGFLIADEFTVRLRPIGGSAPTPRVLMFSASIRARQTGATTLLVAICALAQGALAQGALAQGALAQGALAQGALAQGALAQGALAQGAQNLVANPGFEAGAASYDIPAGLAAPDATVFHEGAKSLKLSNADAANYRYVTQFIGTTGGATYQFSGQIKGENLVSLPDSEQNRGAGIFLEWYDGDGKWLGGSYPDARLGTYDWTRIQSTGKLPLHARRMVLGLYLRQGTTGTAWFDDLQVVATTPPLRSLLVAPGYRGLIAVGDRNDWRADISVNRAPEYGDGLRIRAQITLDGRVVAEKMAPIAPRGLSENEGESLQLTVVQSPGTVVAKAGKAPQWKLDLLDAAGTVLASQEWTFSVASRMPRVTLAPSGVWKIEGQPFFPLGIYSQFESDASDANLQLIAGAGFNTILNYGYGAGKDPIAFLDRAQKYGLKVIYVLKDFTDTASEFPREQGLTPAQQVEKNVNLVKNHPALLAWYLNDESSLEHEAELRALQTQVLSLDAGHPIIHVLNAPYSLDGYYDLTDVLGVDPYPIPGKGLAMVSNWTDGAVKAARGAKSVLLVSQEFSWGVYGGPSPGSRPPTLQEIRTMNLLGLTSKANGVLFYAFMDLWLSSDGKRDQTQRDEAKFVREWGNVSAVSRELKTLLPTLLANQEVALTVQNSLPAQLRFRALKQGGLKQGATTQLIVANADGDNAATLLVTGPTFKRATVQSGDVMVAKVEGGWQISAAPRASGVVSLE